MKVILLERVEKLGTIGDEVDVKHGFGRNYLIPQGKALRANADNRARFEREREAFEQRNADSKASAESEAEKLEGVTFTIIRQAGDTGQLYGSVTARDVSAAAEEAGFTVPRSTVRQDNPIKAIGIYDVVIRLHAEASASIKVNVARSEEEAERQAAGEDVVAAFAEESQAVAAEQAGALAEAASELSDQIGGGEDDD